MKRPAKPTNATPSSASHLNADTISQTELLLIRKLRDAPRQHSYRFSKDAEYSLLEDLFSSLTCNKPEYLHYIFPNGPSSSTKPWNLSEAQGAVEGAEYSAAARGKPCGHIFKNGEATYRCKTCSLDDTCVLCSKCFESSDHSGHIVFVSISPGNTGCCDCGDPEAWRLPVKCAIHTPVPNSQQPMDTDGSIKLPEDLERGIRSTIARAIDYLCDVISCSPEQLRVPKSEEAIKTDEEKSRLTSKYYEVAEEGADNTEFCLVLWNDEKHTINEVEEQVSRACKRPKAFGKARAQETDYIGRSLIIWSTDIKDLLRISRIIEQIKVTVTIRSARDTFREQMCGTIIEWLMDISGCTVGGNNTILRNTICEELLGVWRTGSTAWNTEIGKNGIDDHSYEEDNAREFWGRRMVLPLETFTEGDDMDLDEDNGGEDVDADADGGEDLADALDDDENERDEDDDVDMDELPQPYRQILMPIQEQNTAPVTNPATESASVQRSNDADVPRVPATPGSHHHRSLGPPPPPHWVERPAGISTRYPLPPHENLRQRVRLDWLILFDLRMWKKARIDLRDLYISTVVAIPEFKRILGLRFSGLYTMLSQLYLIADREPDHSIINLSLQILTTPSITAEVVRRGNFLTSLLAILYTFLTTRQVGYPMDVNPNATLAFDAGSLANRRMHHFFQDVRYLFCSDYVQERLRVEDRYILQFLDLVQLHQGICPNIRAVGDHVEYEAEAWISASLITREINKMSRQFSEAFKGKIADKSSLYRAISTTARYAIISSMGWERQRFTMSEVKSELEFKQITNFEFDTNIMGQPEIYEVVNFTVDCDYISFHHALHYTLSWLIEDAKDMPLHEVKELLMFNWDDIGVENAQRREREDLAIAMFDYPLRVCVWLSQMKTGMWVRNGFSLRHQMQTYKSVSQRDLTHNRDIFLLQTAMAVINPSRMLASMIDRFNLHNWVLGKYHAPEGYEEAQILDLAEDFLHLLIVLLSERLCLMPMSEAPDLPVRQLKREIIHILCFKPVTFSELGSRLPDRMQDHEDFQQILADMTNYRPPDGLSDSGTFELKEEYQYEVDPYIMHFTKNQREETEHNYKVRMAKKTGQPEAEVVFEPKILEIPRGVFKNLSAFTQTAIFAQIIYYSLVYAIQFETDTPSIPETRVETYLQICLHLCLLAVLEDKVTETGDDDKSFVLHALSKRSTGFQNETISLPRDGQQTIAGILYCLSKNEKFKAQWPRINHILRRMRGKRPNAFDSTAVWGQELGQKMDLDNADSKEQEMEKKKRLAKERQAKIMAQFKSAQQSFLSGAGMEGYEDISDSEDVDQTHEKDKTWEFPTGTCILCQEETNDSRLYGTFAMAIDSNILRQTNLKDLDYSYEVVMSPDSLDHYFDRTRPFGVASMNTDAVKKLASDGSEMTVERQVLGRGFPSNFVRRGPVATGCGHIMHYSCFEHYFESTKRRQPHHIARAHPERSEKKEFICPLCKALGNTFLPIVWKSKEEKTAGVIQTDISFLDWLSSTIGPLISRLEKAVDSGEGHDKNTVARTQELLFEYGTRTMTGPLANKLYLLSEKTYEKASQESSRAAPAGFAQSIESINRPSANTINMAQVDELHKIYRRIRETLLINKIKSEYSTPETIRTPGDLTHVDTLAKMLGFSISSVEIVQRGIASDPGSILLDKISAQTLTHLKVLSETVLSYITVGGLQGKEKNITIQQYKDMQNQQLQKLFTGHPQIDGTPKSYQDGKKITPLLCEDIFVFLAACSICLIPSLHLEFHQIMQLCYLAEIVKATVAIGTGRSLSPLAEMWSKIEPRGGNTRQIGQFQQFSEFLGHSCDTEGDYRPLPVAVAAVHRHMVEKYATAFLRKAAILVHVRYCVNFPNTGFGDMEEPEMNRLCKALNLPTVDGMISMCLDQSQQGDLLRNMLAGWCRHWAYEEEAIPLSHPCIFELVGLPLHYDTLVEEAMKKKCPHSGKDLADPSVCLFCGEIFCSQALCCMKDNKGGCNQHNMKCAREIGIFINIRKCHVLYLHDGRGTWASAPYLDKHGETDSGLRRNRQLFLNQRRYDALLRNVWLQHGIPTTISRRLEADINTGGWETI